jgi:hypothetical protein
MKILEIFIIKAFSSPKYFGKKGINKLNYIFDKAIMYPFALL